MVQLCEMLFFSDVSAPPASMGGQEAMFADDLNVFREFDQYVPLEQVTEDSQKCRSKVHRWGATNRMSFDPSKELMIVLHPSDAHGAPFKFLACMMDTDLRMHSCIDQILSKARPKITAILRTRGFYSIPDLIIQFRIHIWRLIEMNIDAYFHAASSLLAKTDHAQNRFLQELGLSSEHAGLEYNFAPPKIRRNIAVLGLLQKRVLGKCHPSSDRLMPWYSDCLSDDDRPGHDKPIYTSWVEICA